MCNPDSVEACWIYVAPEHRGKGVYQNQMEYRMKYLKNRPAHSLQRGSNKAIFAATGSKDIVRQVGQEFTLPKEDHKIRLMVQNHDLVYDPDKQFWYGHKAEVRG